MLAQQETKWIYTLNTMPPLGHNESLSFAPFLWNKFHLWLDIIGSRCYVLPVFNFNLASCIFIGISSSSHTNFFCLFLVTLLFWPWYTIFVTAYTTITRLFLILFWTTWTTRPWSTRPYCLVQTDLVFYIWEILVGFHPCSLWFCTSLSIGLFLCTIRFIRV